MMVGVTQTTRKYIQYNRFSLFGLNGVPQIQGSNGTGSRKSCKLLIGGSCLQTHTLRARPELEFVGQPVGISYEAPCGDGGQTTSRSAHYLTNVFDGPEKDSILHRSLQVQQ